MGLSNPAGNALDEDIGVKLFGGYHFSRGISGQVGYVNLGGFDRRGGGTVEVDGLEASLVGRVVINKRVAVIGRLGLYGWDSSAPVAAGGGDNGVDTSFGVGAQYELANAVGIRAQWERFYDAGNTDVNYVSVGVTFGY